MEEKKLLTSSKDNLVKINRLLIQNLIIICLKIKRRKFVVTIKRKSIIVMENQNKYLITNMLEYKRLINHLSCQYRYPLKYFPYIFSESVINMIQEEIKNNEIMTFNITDTPFIMEDETAKVFYLKKIR